MYVNQTGSPITLFNESDLELGFGGRVHINLKKQVVERLSKWKEEHVGSHERMTEDDLILTMLVVPDT